MARADDIHRKISGSYSASLKVCKLAGWKVLGYQECRLATESGAERSFLGKTASSFGQYSILKFCDCLLLRLFPTQFRRSSSFLAHQLKCLSDEVSVLQMSGESEALTSA